MKTEKLGVEVLVKYGKREVRGPYDTVCIDREVGRKNDNSLTTLTA